MHTYIEVFKTALIYFPFVALFFTLPYILYNYHKYGSIVSFKVVIVYSFILYMMTVYFLVILPLPSREAVAASPGRAPNFIPFSFVKDILESREEHRVRSWKNGALFQVLFNVVMLMPYGMYLRYYFKCSLSKTVLFSFLFSLFLELTQLSGLYGFYPKPYRMFDVDDLMANTLGGFVGYWIFGLANKLLPSRQSLDSQSYALGKKVSLLRVMLSAGIDLFCVGILYGMLSFFVQKIPFFVFFTFYLWLLTSFCHGQSIGMKVLQLKIVNQLPQQSFMLACAMRYFSMMIVLFALPTACLRLFVTSFPVFVLIVLFAWEAGALIVVVDILRHIPPFYARISNTRLVSSIHIQ